LYYQVETKNPAYAGFFGFKTAYYSAIELETLCLAPSGLSLQPDKPTTINAIAKSDKTFFIILSSKGV
jgi:hypothetical protein